MRKTLSTMGVLFMALCMCFVASQGISAEKSKAKKSVARKTAKTITLKGDIQKQLNKKGKLLGVQLKAIDGKVYKIALTKTGIQLGKQLDKKKAEVVASVVKRGTKKKPVFWLQVKSYKEIAAETEPAETAGEESGESDE